MDIMNVLNSSTFVFSLRWLDEEKNWKASVIISVVEKPFKFQREFNIFLKEQ